MTTPVIFVTLVDHPLNRRLRAPALVRARQLVAVRLPPNCAVVAHDGTHAAREVDELLGLLGEMVSFCEKEPIEFGRGEGRELMAKVRRVLDETPRLMRVNVDGSADFRVGEPR